jgi:pantetheine-phosphate adenylyltransferase
MKTIALYPGSFNPIHIGHINILEKAERIFGKGNVITSIGINPDKELSDIEDNAHIVEQKINRKVITYTGFLHQLVEKYEQDGYNVVIIRGLRNGADLDYEVNQFRFINDFKKDINVVYITCDKEYEHISSSAIKKIRQLGSEDMVKKYLI